VREGEENDRAYRNMQCTIGIWAGSADFIMAVCCDIKFYFDSDPILLPSSATSGFKFTFPKKDLPRDCCAA
jgi:hypothetical protein